jgi:hypothetical protein
MINNEWDFMTYRKRYWTSALRQIHVALIMIWYGVILNRGHHSKWKRK